MIVLFLLALWKHECWQRQQNKGNNYSHRSMVDSIKNINHFPARKANSTPYPFLFSEMRRGRRHYRKIRQGVVGLCTGKKLNLLLKTHPVRFHRATFFQHYKEVVNSLICFKEFCTYRNPFFSCRNNHFCEYLPIGPVQPELQGPACF